MIESKDVTFVVQGQIGDPLIAKSALLSIKKYFPDSPIILSTWEGEHIEGLLYDTVVFSADPGTTVVNESTGMKFNINRQIVSSIAGLERVTTKYAIKTRTDTKFISARLINEYHKKNVFYGDAIDGEPRILVLSDFFLNPRLELPMPFHASDFLILGPTEKVMEYFPEKLMSDEWIQWYKYRNVPDNYPASLSGMNFRFAAEQYFFLSYLTNGNPLQLMDNAYQSDEETILVAENAIKQHLIVLPSIKLGIKNLKHPKMYLGSHLCYTQSEIMEIMSKGFLRCKKFDFERFFIKSVVFLGKNIKAMLRILLKLEK